MLYLAGIPLGRDPGMIFNIGNMRVLWFADTPSNYSAPGSPFNGTGWVSALENEISGKLDLAVAFIDRSARRRDSRRSDQKGPDRVTWNKDVQHGVTYYPIRRRFDRRDIDRLVSVVTGRSRKEEALVGLYAEIVRDFRPDIIQIFGSEHSYGLVAEKVDVPVLLHLQSIMNPYFKAFLPPGVNWREYLYTPFTPGSILHKFLIRKRWEWACAREARIFKAVRYYLGRTGWDREQVLKFNPDARFFHGGEILRQPFYYADIDAIGSIPSTLRLVTTISEPTYKGFDMVLRTGLILKETYGIDFAWNVYGNVDPAFFERITGITAERAGITVSGVATAEQLVDAIAHSSMYVHPSYIDNSPNSVCEAQLLGAAVVATNVGGVPSLIEDGVNGFLVRSGNPEEIAERVVAMYRNKTLLRRVGHQARDMALARHDRQAITRELLSVYRTITGLDPESSTN